MINKKNIEDIEQLLNSTSKDTRTSVDNWKEFLNTASKLHKYKFAEQLLIYVQNPDATACATMDFWKNNFNNYVAENSNAISILKKDEYNKPYVEYVFDVKDIVSTEISPPLHLWQLQDNMQDYVIQGLSKKYDVVSNDNFIDNLLELTSITFNQKSDVLFQNIEEHLSKSSFNSFENEKTMEIFKEIAIASIQYIVLARCGINPDLYIDNDKFENLSLFNTNKIFSGLGNSCQEISKDMLTSIGKICNAIEKLNEKNISQTKQNEEKPLENQTNLSYNNIDLDIKTNKEELKNETTNNLHENQRLPSTKPDFERENEELARPSGEMGENEGQIPSRHEQSNVDADGWNFVGEYLSNRQNSDRTIQPDVEKSIRSFDDGRATTANGTNSNGDRGDNQRGDNFLKTLTDEQLNKIISHSINFDEKSNDIVAFFDENFNSQDRINFINNLIVDESLTLFKGQVLGFELNENEINLFVSNGINKIAEINLTLDEFSNYISIVLIPPLYFEPEIAEQVLDVDEISKQLPSIKDNIKEIHENYVKENPDTVLDTQDKIIEQLRDVMFSQLSPDCATILKIREDDDFLTKVFTNENGKDFSLSYANLGNGTTIANRLDTDNDNEWVKLAHIDNVGHINYYVDDLPPLAIKKIEEHANAIFEEIKDEYLPLKENAIKKISQSYYALDYMIPELQADRDVILAGVQNDGRAFRYASNELKKDEELLTIALKTDPRAIEHASNEFIENNKNICLDIIKQDPFCMLYLRHTNLTKDKDFVSTAVENKGVNLEYAPLFQNDPDVVLKALIQDPNSFEYVSDELKEQFGNIVDEFIQNINATNEVTEEITPTIDDVVDENSFINDIEPIITKEKALEMVAEKGYHLKNCKIFKMIKMLLWLLVIMLVVF